MWGGAAPPETLWAVHSRGPGWLPAARTSVACTAGADLNPLPESEGKLPALQSAPGAAPAWGSRRAREQSWPGCSCQGRRGPSEAAKAGWGGRGRASWGWS